MSVFSHPFVLVPALLVVGFSTFILLRSLRTVASAPVFEDLSAPEPQQWPGISVIIPACDDGASLSETVASLRNQGLPHLEIILVDDRSRDGTGLLMDQLARDHEHTRVIHIKSLPDGWLGKVHALHKGTLAANGEWLLFTDADVVFASDILRKALAIVLDSELDHLTLLPRFTGGTLLRRIAVSTFEQLALEQSRITEIGKPGSDAFLGVGAFNLVKASKLAETPGLSWLRMEVIDDVGLALMLHRAGAKARAAICRHALSLEWYPTMTHMFRGLEKNIFAAFGYSSWKTLGAAAGLPAILLAPIVLLFTPWWPVSIFNYGLFLGLVIQFRRRMCRPIIPALLNPAGLLLIMAMMLRSMILCLKRGGINWRGTFYDLSALKEGQRGAHKAFSSTSKRPEE